MLDSRVRKLKMNVENCMNISIYTKYYQSHNSICQLIIFNLYSIYIYVLKELIFFVEE